MARQEITVHELVGMIERGELRLPEMQRGYVWRAPRVRDLLDSLYRGYPSGAILVWDTDDAPPQRAFAVGQEGNAFKKTRLLLDGQQRLTSLSAVIRGEPVQVRGRKRPIEVLFNLNHPDQLAVVTDVEEDKDDDFDEDDIVDGSEDEVQQRFERMAFVIATSKLEELPHWVKVTDVFKTDSDAGFLKRAGVSGFDDPIYEKYSKRLARLRAIRKYAYRMDILESDLSYEEVTEIFVRVNSLGAKLRGSDLALAQITARWHGALATFQGFEANCRKLGFDFGLGILLKNLVAFATGQSRFKTVGRLQQADLERAWHESVKGMNFAINFVKNNVGIESSALLSSPFILIAVAAYGHRCQYDLDATEALRLRFWTLVANAKGRYSRGSTETMLDQDLSTINAGSGVAALIDRLRTQVGRLDVVPEELEGRNQRSALFKTMFLAFQKGGAIDWRSKVAISLDHAGAQHRLQFHHVFPKAVLKGHYSSREADDIANLSFIGGGTNRKISAKPPVDYFPKTLEKAGAEAFDAQCIPTDGGLLALHQYRNFLAERRRRIALRLNDFIGTVP